jgi:ubiquitin carboxyl-terminal hydrolase 5/13
MYKVADGLLSGRYSVPVNGDSPKSSSGQGGEGGELLHQSPTPVFQNGVKPMTLKAVIGKGHAEFSTMRQQDSEEFLSHLLNTLRRDIHKYKQQDPSKIPFLDIIRFLTCQRY